LGNTPKTVHDIGGGTGPYSFWLAEMGHAVHLSDIVPKHIEIAASRNHGNLIRSIQIEDARTLTYEDESTDFVLLNGPLYHLISRKERLQVLRECLRVLKPEGLVFAVGISRQSGLLYALSSGEVFNDSYFSMVEHEIETGIRENLNKRNKTFIEAYFHSPEELKAEIETAGFQVIEIRGILGPAWNTPNLKNVIQDDEKKKRLLRVSELMEKIPEFSPKILCLGRKAT
jgi:ubiquinone/menaquinone biosynthesis C-methylase UbiE